MGSIDDLVRDLRRFENRKTLLTHLRAEIRKPVPAVRKSIKARALAILPHRGGLNVWVSKVRITAVIKTAGRSAGVKLKGGRSSTGGKSDMRRIDGGRVRAPSWGRRGPGSWHNQSVPSGFFTEPASEAREWRAAAVTAVDRALDTIRRG